jgi:hypothetical protein
MSLFKSFSRHASVRFSHHPHVVVLPCLREENERIRVCVQSLMLIGQAAAESCVHIEFAACRKHARDCCTCDSR